MINDCSVVNMYGDRSSHLQHLDSPRGFSWSQCQRSVALVKAKGLACTLQDAIVSRLEDGSDQQVLHTLTVCRIDRHVGVRNYYTCIHCVGGGEGN